MEVCESLCFLCPDLRTRSRHPVKRYKKLLAEIFPKSQVTFFLNTDGSNFQLLTAGYITVYLEQKFFKELRAERFGSVNVVMAIYRKIDSTYMFNLESQIPKLCHLAQELGEKEKISILHAAGLQALSSMVVSAVLENYESPYANSENNDDTVEDKRSRWVNEVLKADGHDPPGVTILARVSSWKDIRSAHGALNLTIEESGSPNFWSGICLHNLARISREATTIRRVLETIFRYFDNNNVWSPSKGLALCVLLDMQIVMEKSGQNTHILLSMLVKHLEHKNVSKLPDMILDIIEVTSRLTEHSKAQSSTAIMSAISDMVRHLGKSMQSLDSDAGAGDDNKWNNRYRKAVDECLVQLSRKVGDAGPILDTLAVVLENISSTTPVARSTISAAYRTAQIIASLPNLTYKSKADPFLRLVEDLRLQSLDSAAYGSKEDDDLALKSLSHINMNDQSKQIAVSIILDSLELSESELNTARNQLFEDFSADDVCPIGSHFIASPSKSPAYNAKMHQKSLEVIPMGFVFEDDTFVEPDSLGEPQSRNPSDNSLLDVNQLLESVGELSNRKLESSEPDSPTDELIPLTNNDQCYSNFCKLPVLNPYDKFLTSAGC
ncbi:hypothetical protein ACQ4PT_070716 [Festuca glaucescens]